MITDVKATEVQPANSPEDLVVASATFPKDLLELIDKRAKALDMNRSQYFRWLSRRDLAALKPEAKDERQPELMGVGK